MMIYFVRRSNGDIKIGKSMNFSNRLKSLEKRYGKLQLMGFSAGSLCEERDLHEKFKHLRKDGEFFDPAPELIDVIRVRVAGLAVPPTEYIHFDRSRYSQISKRLGIEMQQVSDATEVEWGTLCGLYYDVAKRITIREADSICKFFKCELDEMFINPSKQISIHISTRKRFVIRDIDEMIIGI